MFPHFMSSNEQCPLLPQLQGFRSSAGCTTFEVMLHGKPRTTAAPEDRSDTEVKLSLRAMSNSDTNEVLARLTE